MERVLRWAMPIVQAAITAALMFILITSGILPGKYLGIVAAVVAAALLITVLFACAKNGAVRTTGNVLAIFVCGMLVFGTVYLNQIIKTLNSVAGSDTEIKVIAVFVKDDNAATCIEETQGYRFGVYEGADCEQIVETIKEVEQRNGNAAPTENAEHANDKELNMSEYSSPLEMAQALLDGEIDAAICNKAYVEILDEVIVDFSSKSRIIFEKEYETATADTSDKSYGSDSLSEEETAKRDNSSKRTSLTKEPYTILISGIDVSGPISTTSRSDVNILMTVNPLTHQILLTTTPRDYYVYIPEISGDERDKLTHAGIYGIKASMRTLEDLYGIEISDYIRINFDSLIRLVDALDGVDVYSEYEFNEGEHFFYRGTNHLNGEEALAFSKNRYAFASGDEQRGKNQMLVLTAIINKLMSPALLKNPSEVLDVVGSSMQTSIGSNEIADAIAWQLDTGSDWNISRQSVTGTGDSDQTFSMKGTNLYVMWPDEDSVSEAAEKIREVME